MSDIVVAHLPSDSNVPSPQESICNVSSNPGSVYSKNCVTKSGSNVSLSRRRNNSNASKNAIRCKQTGGILENFPNPACSENTNRAKPNSYKKNRRLQKRRNKGNCGTLSPSAISSSLTSIATTSSGHSSGTNCSRVNDNDELMKCGSKEKSSSSSAGSSSAGFYDITSNDDVDEDDLSEKSSSLLNYSDDSVFFDSFYLKHFELNSNLFPNTSKKGGKRNKRKSLVKQYPDLSNPEIQKYYNEQRLFYRVIYEQQFAAMNAITVKTEKTKEKLNGKIKYIPHQHLGLPPIAPPPTGNYLLCSSYEDFVNCQDFMGVQSSCEAAFFERLRANTIKKPKSLKSWLESGTMFMKKNENKEKTQPIINNNVCIKKDNTIKASKVSPDCLQLRAEFRRQIKELISGPTENDEDDRSGNFKK